MKTNVERFVEANRISPVVSGKALGNGGQGAAYLLKNGTYFKLTSEECRQVTPRWAI